ncbi:MAG: hypothetical protein NXI00_24510 [Cytophagales bacterium]|nr:hypothetical protein [Cytophagales bacterium]
MIKSRLGGVFLPEEGLIRNFSISPMGEYPHPKFGDFIDICNLNAIKYNYL